jgi:hypothetical protein
MKKPLNLYYFRACALRRADRADHEEHNVMHIEPLLRIWLECGSAEDPWEQIAG